MTAFAQPWVATVFGAFMLCAETCDHFESIIGLPATWRDLPVYDWIAGILLIWAASLARRDWTAHRAYLTAGWAFMLSLLSGALYGHIGDWFAGTGESHIVSEGALLIILIGLNGIALCGLIATLRHRSG